MHSRARALAAGLALVLAVGLTSAAHAQLGDPGEDTLDTDVTPVAKESERWSWVAGAKYSSDGPKPSDVPEGSVTPFELDFFTVSFFDPHNGLAGGAVCREPVRAGASADEAREHTDTCERVPVIYRYSVDDSEEASWEEVYRGDSPGFVGAIDWLGPDRALAVGGDGTYPRREPNAAESDQGRIENDPAGDARAWLYEDGSWRKLEDLPEGMRGLSALDAYPGNERFGVDYAIAGGLGQLWHWREGAFAESFDSASSPADPAQRPELFYFRVREVRYAPLAASETEPREQAFAVTAGCCAETQTANLPRLLAYSGGRWYVRRFDFDPDAASGADSDELRRQGARVTPSDSYYSFALRRGSAKSWPGDGNYALSVIAAPGGPVDEREPSSSILGPHAVSGNGRPSESPPPLSDLSACPAALGIQVVGAPGPLGVGTGIVLEGLVFGGGNTVLGWAGCSFRGGLFNVVNASTMRLVSGDGDVGGVPRWAVGAQRSSGQGVAFGSFVTNPNPPALKPFLKCTSGTAGDFTNPSSNCVGQLSKGDPSGTAATGLALSESSPSPGQVQDSQRSHRLFRLPSYALNAFDMVGVDSGWAVGEHGAILQLSDEQAFVGASEPQPPVLGHEKPRPLPDSQPYDGFRPDEAPGQPSEIPPLAGQPPVQLPEPRLVAAGSPNPTQSTVLDPTIEEVGSIVMSRDGDEGWALGAPPSGEFFSVRPPDTTLYHYDGGAWTRCDSGGISGYAAPDPACAALDSFHHFRRPNGALTPLRLVAATRVPLEADGDPTNDDEFEVIALARGGSAGGPGKGDEIVRYRGDPPRWQLEEPKSTGEISGFFYRDVACLAPDDCWIVADTNGLGAAAPLIYRFDGERWLDCSRPANQGSCGNQSGLLPFANGDRNSSSVPRFGLASADDRLYMFGARAANPDPTRSETERRPFPMIIYRGRGGVWRNDAGGHDPFLSEGALASDKQGRVRSLAVARQGDGRYEGWAIGQFGDSKLLRLAPGEGWKPWTASDAASDYLGAPNVTNRAQLTLPGDGPASPAFIVPNAGEAAGSGELFPILSFNGEREQWEVLPAPFSDRFPHVGHVRALAPDNQGGFWAAVRDPYIPYGTFFYHYTDHPPRPLFDDVPNPLDNRITAMAGATDGTIWVANKSGVLARYDRLTGWYTTRIPGWDHPRSSIQSVVNAIALGPDGNGVAVGKQGRIADIGPGGVGLDAAAGTLCDPRAVQAPCGTSRDLRAAAVAPDGSAMVGGDSMALLWRPPGGEFRAIPRPPGDDGIIDVAMPRPDRAWLLTKRVGFYPGGPIWAGEMTAPGEWRWRLENLDENGEVVGLKTDGVTSSLRALAVDAAGHGYAVGDRGLILERTGDGDHPWKRLDSPFTDHLRTVTLPAGGGPGALIGGESGLILTLNDGRFQIARPADPYTIGPGQTEGSQSVGLALEGHSNLAAVSLQAPIVSMALVPGPGTGEAEAWAVLARHGSGRSIFLHYASDPGDPLLDPVKEATPPPRRSRSQAGRADVRGLRQVRLSRLWRSPLSADERLQPDPRADRAAGDGRDTRARPAGRRPGVRRLHRRRPRHAEPQRAVLEPRGRRHELLPLASALAGARR